MSLGQLLDKTTEGYVGDIETSIGNTGKKSDLLLFIDYICGDKYVLAYAINYPEDTHEFLGQDDVLYKYKITKNFFSSIDRYVSCLSFAYEVDTDTIKGSGQGNIPLLKKEYKIYSDEYNKRYDLPWTMY
jgi:hypothetical protein